MMLRIGLIEAEADLRCPDTQRTKSLNGELYIADALRITFTAVSSELDSINGALPGPRS